MTRLSRCLLLLAIQLLPAFGHQARSPRDRGQSDPPAKGKGCPTCGAPVTTSGPQDPVAWCDGKDRHKLKPAPGGTWTPA